LGNIISGKQKDDSRVTDSSYVWPSFGLSTANENGEEESKDASIVMI
jgi:hypothetical protein